MLLYRRAEFDASERLARESLRILAKCRSLRGVDLCLNLIGGALRQRGQWHEARRYFDRALRRARADGNIAQALRISNNLATVEMATGHPDEAIARCEALLAEHSDTDDKLGVAMTLIILGNAYSATRRREAAQRWYEQGLALAEQHQLVTVKPFFLQSLGSCHREQGRLDIAREFYLRTLASSPEGLERQIEIYAWLGLARVEMRRDCDAAVNPLQKALAVAMRAHSPAWQAAVIAGWGEWHAARGDHEHAAMLLSFAALSASIDANLAREAQQRLDDLGLSAAQITAARSMAAGMSVERIVAGLPAAPAA
jgi:tetratricopeptide (TPR) repeat protein